VTAFTLTYDCADPAVLAEFWKTALGYVDAPPPQGFETWEAWFVACAVPEDERDDGAALVDPAGVLPRLSFLKVPEPKAAKNRLHLDLQVAGGRALPDDVRWPRITATVERLVAAGGSVVRTDGHDHVVMADPEGNEFCVA
jgi:hypothetical protein